MGLWFKIINWQPAERKIETIYIFIKPSYGTLVQNIYYIYFRLKFSPWLAKLLPISWNMRQLLSSQFHKVLLLLFVVMAIFCLLFADLAGNRRLRSEVIRMAQVYLDFCDLFTTFWLLIPANRRLRLLFVSFAPTHTRDANTHTRLLLTPLLLCILGRLLLSILLFYAIRINRLRVFVLPAFAAYCCCFRSCCCCYCTLASGAFLQQQKILSTNCAHTLE